jgi:cathepsin B
MSLGGLEMSPEEEALYPEQTYDVSVADLPESFNAAEQWPECPSITRVFDQSTCGSCWAVASATAATDRLCISTQGQDQTPISVNDVLSCCRNCGSGCRGGFPLSAWNFMSSGVVSGGDFNDTSSCRPYPLEPCLHHVFTSPAGTDDKYKKCPDGLSRTPRCERRCQSDYDTPYAQDQRRFLGRGYRIRGEANMMKELVTNGPFSVMFRTYSDFLHYKSGVYTPRTGSFLGLHVIKVLGYGVDAATNTPYWLCANSWNETYGDNGFIYFRRGQNSAGIESSGAAAKPRA